MTPRRVLLFFACAAFAAASGCEGIHPVPVTSIGGGSAGGTGGEGGTGGGVGGAGGAGGGMGGAGASLPAPPWLDSPHILVSGETATANDCTTGICRHNENTDLVAWNGAIFLVHRTAVSQILGPNSSLRVSRSDDGGKTFTLQAILPAPSDRDIRDPHFYVVGDELYIKTLTRLPSNQLRDAGTDTIAQCSHSKDGKTWSTLSPIGPEHWSFWRIKQQDGVYYSAAYEDGDLEVKLFSSTDGVAWTQGADVYTMSADTPLETELVFMPGTKKLLALVRMDGTDEELLGDSGRLRTAVCWSDPPYSSFSCPADAVFNGYRLDGPLAFFHDGRLFVVARKHLHDGTYRKRTALYEITGDFLHGGAIAIKEWGEIPSAGDTSYAGQASIDADHVLVSWYSGDIDKDESWIFGMEDITDIWQGVLDFPKLK